MGETCVPYCEGLDTINALHEEIARLRAELAETQADAEELNRALAVEAETVGKLRALLAPVVALACRRDMSTRRRRRKGAVPQALVVHERWAADTDYDVVRYERWEGFRAGQVKTLRCRYCRFGVGVVAHHRAGDKSGQGRYNRARAVMLKHLCAEHRGERPQLAALLAEGAE